MGFEVIFLILAALVVVFTLSWFLRTRNLPTRLPLAVLLGGLGRRPDAQQ